MTQEVDKDENIQIEEKNSVAHHIDKRKKILEMNNKETDCNIFPEMIQDDVKSRWIYVFFIMGFFLSFRTIQQFIEIYFQLRAMAAEEEMTEEEAAQMKEIQQALLLGILLFGIKIAFYIFLVFLFGYSNSTPDSRMKTSVLTFIFLVALIGTLVATEFVTDFSSAFEVVLIGLMAIYNLMYIISSCRKKGRVFLHFTKQKNHIFFEYTFQKLFKRPSHYWLQRQKKIFIKREKLDPQQVSSEEINEKFKEYIKEQKTPAYETLGLFKKVIK